MRHFNPMALAIVVVLSMALPAPMRAAVVEPHATVRGKTLEQWSAEWWQKVFSIPVYAADGTTIVNPQFDAGLKPTDTVAAPHGLSSNDGQIFFLFGTFFGGTLERTVNVPAGKPVFVPIVNDEWSNPDTAAAPDFKNLPGNFTQEELAAFAKAQTDTITGLSASLDGQDIPDLLAHRETAPPFSYTQPASNSITQVFFSEDITGPVPSAADGYYLMFEPLAPGEHTLRFTGSSPDNTGTPPLLGAFTVDLTYHLNVGAAPIPLPAGVWLGLSGLPLAAAAVRRAGRVGRVVCRGW